MGVGSEPRYRVAPAKVHRYKYIKKLVLKKLSSVRRKHIAEACYLPNVDENCNTFTTEIIVYGAVGMAFGVCFYSD